MIRLSELVFDHIFSVDFYDCLRLFLFCIISPKSRWCAMIPDVVPVDVWELPFRLYSVDKDRVGLRAIEDLSCNIAMIYALAIGKQWICRYSLIYPSHIHVRKSRLDMPPKGVSNNH